MDEKVGLPPGTVVQTGIDRAEKVTISVMEFAGDQMREYIADSIEDCSPPLDKKATKQVHVCGVHDIDIVIKLRSPDIDRFRSAFPSKQFYCPPFEVIQIEITRKQHSHFNLIHHESGLKADCYPFTGDALHAWAFQNIRKITLDENLSIKLAPPEYVIIRKMQFYREGGAKKHLQDIEAMIEISGDKIDKNFLVKELKHKGLETLLDELSVALQIK